MDYLTLVQEVHRESGSGGVAPTTLVGLKGENLRLKQWVNTSYRHILRKYTDWKFMWAQSTFSTIVGQAGYNPLDLGVTLAPNSGIREYDRKTFFLDGEPLEVADYLSVKEEVLETANGTPYRVVLMPDDTLRLDPPPSAVQTVKFDYWGSIGNLIVNTDEPAFPVQFHEAIIGKALMYYASYENAPEIMAHGGEIYAEVFGALEADQLPGDRYVHRLAEGSDMVISVE